MRVILTIIILTILSCTKTSTEVSTIKFEVRDNIPFIYTTINGKGAKLIIDSGASQSLIDENLKNHYKFSVLEKNGIVSGVGGTAIRSKVSGLEVKYNDSILDIDFNSINFKEVRLKSGVAGVIGGDFLSKNKLIINYNTKEITKANIKQNE